MSDFWVFGYGSLIWNPGFEFEEEHKAILYGRRRTLCVHSWVHRGTQQAPGLVLGLDTGGCCQGIARRVKAEKREPVIAYLRERELVTNVYLEKWLKVRLENGNLITALTYVVDRSHAQYAGAFTLPQTIERVSHASGKSGLNRDYVLNTVKSLRQLSIHDHRLEAVASGLATD